MVESKSTGIVDRRDRWRSAVLTRTATISDAIKSLDNTGLQIVLIANDKSALEGTITDGDIRRALLAGCQLSDRVDSVFQRDALVVGIGATRETAFSLMKKTGVRHIPIVDSGRRLVGLYLWEDMSASMRNNVLVIMAGGLGLRLRPATEHCPKPMLPVAGRPMLEHIILHARTHGITKFVIAIHYLGSLIEEYFADGSSLGIDVSYIREEDPLGTAGALQMVDPGPAKTFLITNGDVMAKIDYAGLINFHELNEADVTVAVQEYEHHHPYGVVTTNGSEVIEIEEKPIYKDYINTGIYAMSSSALIKNRPSGPYDMPDILSV